MHLMATTRAFSPQVERFVWWEQKAVAAPINLVEKVMDPITGHSDHTEERLKRFLRWVAHAALTSGTPCARAQTGSGRIWTTTSGTWRSPCSNKT